MTIKNGQSRETGNIRYTRHWTEEIPKGQSRMDNPEKLETLGTQSTGRRQKKNKKTKKQKTKKIHTHNTEN